MCLSAFQAYVEFFTSKENVECLLKVLSDYPGVNYHILNERVSSTFCSVCARARYTVFVLHTLEKSDSTFSFFRGISKQTVTSLSRLL